MSRFLSKISKSMLFQTSMVAVATTASVLNAGLDSATAAPCIGPDSSIAKQSSQQTDLKKLMAKWDKTVSELKSTIGSLRELDSKPPTAGSLAERKTLFKKYDALRKQIGEIRVELCPVFISSMTEKKELDSKTKTLASELAQLSLQAEDYITAYNLTKSLTNKGDKSNDTYRIMAKACELLDRYTEAKACYSKIMKPSDPNFQAMANQLDERAKLLKDELAIRAKEAKANDLPLVELQTSAGSMVIELFENQAPNTVANFISLVEKGYYDGLNFHRVLPRFMAQGGCPDGTGAGGPGYRIDCECGRKDYRRHFSGTLSMAHIGKNTGGSQFFITFVSTPHLDGRHTAFGRVVKGLDILPKITRINPQARNPDVTPSKIIKAKVIRKRGHDYQPKTHPER